MLDQTLMEDGRPRSFRRPRLLLCALAPSPDLPDDPAAAVVGELMESAWAPPGAHVCGAVAPAVRGRAAQAVERAMLDCGCDGVLLIGADPKARAFKVGMRAQNRTAPRKSDGTGAALGREKISPTGPAVARATAPVAAMVEAVKAAGLPAQACSDAGDRLCNYTLYRLLTEVALDASAPTVGLLQLPAVLELDGRAIDPSRRELADGVRAAATGFATYLTPARVPA